MKRLPIAFGVAFFFVIAAGSAFFFLPDVVARHVQNEKKQAVSVFLEHFPVTVDPVNKIIVENTAVNSFFEVTPSPLQAAAINVEKAVWDILEWIASSLTDIPWYQNIAAAGGRVVTITPGMRKEQAASAFAKALAWNAVQTKEFTTATDSSSLPFREGSFSPGTYVVNAGMAPREAQALVNERFSEEILDHYSTSTAAIVPLNQALTIASLIQREAGGADDMRIISGIIWNRLFINMNLQIDASIQYVKANSKNIASWWPRVMPGDIYRKSPYNTYQNAGLPPSPIANPSVAAVLAALNPKNTPCMFYFHDNAGQFHCTNTYAEHVALLKKYFGRGK
jgi:UPF0755 protein